MYQPSDRHIKNSLVSRIVAFLAVLALLSGCQKPVTTMFLSGTTMGTQYSLTIVKPGDVASEMLQQRVESLLREVNKTMSTYDEESELSRLNLSESTEWIEISEDLYTVLDAASVVARDSGGAFDVTIGPVVNLWGFGPTPGTGRMPESVALEQAHARVGVGKFELQSGPNALRKIASDVNIDLSGIAKGYAVDRLSWLFSQLGVHDFLIDIGGEMSARGTNPDGADWQIGLEMRAGEGTEIGPVIEFTNASLASSGNYRNFFELDGVRYGHTIDPKTGMPTQHRLAGVTVLHDSSMFADAWATALMSLGFEAGLEIARQQSLAALFVVHELDAKSIYTTVYFDRAVTRR
jgi:thiamine biosynthesis lipoprotein